MNLQGLEQSFETILKRLAIGLVPPSIFLSFFFVLSTSRALALVMLVLSVSMLYGFHLISERVDNATK